MKHIFVFSYPNEVIHYKGSQLIKTKKSARCAECGESTYCCDIMAFCHLCSKECIDKYWEGFWKAVSK